MKLREAANGAGERWGIANSWTPADVTALGGTLTLLAWLSGDVIVVHGIAGSAG